MFFFQSSNFQGRAQYQHLPFSESFSFSCWSLLCGDLLEQRHRLSALCARHAEWQAYTLGDSSKLWSKSVLNSLIEYKNGNLCFCFLNCLLTIWNVIIHRFQDLPHKMQRTYVVTRRVGKVRRAAFTDKPVSLSFWIYSYFLWGSAGHTSSISKYSKQASLLQLLLELVKHGETTSHRDK